MIILLEYFQFEYMQHDSFLKLLLNFAVCFPVAFDSACCIYLTFASFLDFQCIFLNISAFYFEAQSVLVGHPINALSILNQIVYTCLSVYRISSGVDIFPIEVRLNKRD